MWSYEEALHWLYERQSIGIKLGLGKVERLLAALGKPQESFRSIHVAGTNGKGSVARIVASALGGSGSSVGLTTSPHLVRFCERIEVDGSPITKQEVARSLETIRAHVDSLDEAGEPPTFFEIVTALAFLHFASRSVDWAVVETGMGGRLDATNVLHPQLTIITNIDLDHQVFLGDDIRAIASEKAGIMKPGVPLVTAATGEPLRILKERSQELQVPMSVIGEDYVARSGDDGLHLIHPRGEAHYPLPSPGQTQAENAATAVAAIHAIVASGHAVREAALANAVATSRLPGRLEQILHRRNGAAATVLLDGAHNPSAARTLRFHLGELGWGAFHLIVGFMHDKQWQTMLDDWMPLAAKVWCVPVRSPRTLEPEAIRSFVADAGFLAKNAPDAATALDKAVQAGADRIVVAGSLFLVGEARAHLLGQEVEEIGGSQ